MSLLKEKIKEERETYSLEDKKIILECNGCGKIKEEDGEWYFPPMSIREIEYNKSYVRQGYCSEECSIKFL